MGRVRTSLFGNVMPKRRILTMFSMIYLVAFGSLYIQLPGLYGDNGVTPVRLLQLTKPSSFPDFMTNPNLLRLSSFLNLEAYPMLELCVLTGVLLSFLSAIWEGFRTFPVFTFLWACYFAAFKAGQVFLWFQWDMLLLESGFLAILLTFTSMLKSMSKASDRISLWLCKWLLFRLMFSSGVVKLASNDASWWKLTALHWHYQSQCIPTPLAWYFHQLPGWFHSLCVTSTLIIEIALPFLFFVPHYVIRRFSFYAQALLQVMIIATGNYTFFNFLTIALCYSLLSDDDFGRKKSTGSWFTYFVALLMIGTALSACGYLFHIRIEPDHTISTNIGFSKIQFDWFVDHAIQLSMYFALALFAITVMLSIFEVSRSRGTWRKLTGAVSVLLVGSIGVVLLITSLVSFARLAPHPPVLPKSVNLIHKQVQPYELVHSYGPFRRMTGVNGRPELIIEGASSESGPWFEYTFRYKPGPVDRMPPFVAPHQPRLDWQMWFAALGSPQKHPWLSNLVYRLLSQEKDVMDLLDSHNMPQHPTHIRVRMYTYTFTRSNTHKDWWRRVAKSVYMEPVSVNSPTLLSVVTQTGIVGKRRPAPRDPTPLSLALTTIRQWIGQIGGIQQIIAAFLLVLITKHATHVASNTVAAD